jgi:alkylated DNA nucleotide flippase Atl1
MEELLLSEGIEFNNEGNVNMKKHLWIPPKQKLRAKSRS